MTISSTDAAKEVMNDLRERRKNPLLVPGRPTGLKKFDKLVGGIQHDDFIVLGAETGAGKSVFAGYLAVKLAEQFYEEGKGKVVRIVHGEMTIKSFQQRIAAWLSEVPIRNIQTGNVTDLEMGKVYDNLLYVAKLPIEYIQDPTTFEETEEFIRQDGNCGFWIIDHLQVHPVRDNLSPLDARGAHQITKDFFRLAKNVCPGMGLSQLTNEIAKRPDHWPTKADLYGGKMIQANSSKVWLLYDRFVYERDSWEKDRGMPRVVYLICDKNRHGDVGSEKLRFEPSTLGISEAL